MLMMTNCSKDSDNPPSESTESYDEPLPASVVAILDSIPTKSVKMSDVLLPNGVKVTDFLAQHDPDFLKDFPPAQRSNYGTATTGIGDSPASEKKLWLIARMLEVGMNYIDNTQHYNSNGAANEPEQFGLAYVYGAREITKRQSAEEWRVRQTPQPTGPYCTDRLFGIDCSGFAATMLDKAGIRGMSRYNADSMFYESVWNRTLKHAPENLSGIEAKKYTSAQLSADKLEPGDVIFWQNPESLRIPHMGVVLHLFNGGVTIFQSNGDKKAEPNKPCSSNYRANNMNASKRGPRLIYIPDINNGLTPLTYAGAIRFKFTEPSIKLAPGVDNQVGKPNQALPRPIKLQVLDSDDKPIKNAAITFTTASGNGTTAPATTTSDMTGEAQTKWTLGSTLGPQVLIITATVTPSTGPPQKIEVKVTATAQTICDGLPVLQMEELEVIYGPSTRDEIPFVVLVRAKGGTPPYNLTATSPAAANDSCGVAAQNITLGPLSCGAFNPLKLIDDTMCFGMSVTGIVTITDATGFKVQKSVTVSY